jgi:hypothetical protein
VITAIAAAVATAAQPPPMVDTSVYMDPTKPVMVRVAALLAQMVGCRRLLEPTPGSIGDCGDSLTCRMLNPETSVVVLVPSTRWTLASPKVRKWGVGCQVLQALAEY